MASEPQSPAGQQQDARQGWSRRALKAFWAVLRCGAADGPRPDLSAEIEQLRELASKQLEEDLQQLLADLIPLAYRICEMRTSHSDQLAAMFRSIVPMITADHPNLTICQRMYVETALLANWQRSCGMRLIYMVGRGRSGSAGLAGMLLALVMAMVPSWLILSQFESDGGSVPVEQPAAQTETIEAEESADPVDEEAEESDHTFQIEERAAENAVVGTLGRPSLGASPVYEIIEGNDDAAFAIDNENGTLVVADGLLLDHETDPVRRLTLAVTDAEPTETLSVTVMVTDANDPPSLVHHIFVVSEHAGPSTEVGTLTAIDQDEDEILTFGITAGNEGGVFDVNPETGRLRVVQPSALNHDRASSLTLKIEVSDRDGASNFGTVTIHVTPGKEDPLTPYEREDVFALLMSAFLGSLASIVLSLAATPEAKSPQLYDPATVFIRSFFKPLVAMIFALAVFSVLKTGLVSISGLNVSQGGEIQFHILWVIGFLSGFSERFAPRIFGQVSGGHERPPL